MDERTKRADQCQAGMEKSPCRGQNPHNSATREVQAEGRALSLADFVAFVSLPYFLLQLFPRSQGWQGAAD